MAGYGEGVMVRVLGGATDSGVADLWWSTSAAYEQKTKHNS